MRHPGRYQYWYGWMILDDIGIVDDSMIYLAIRCTDHYIISGASYMEMPVFMTTTAAWMP